MELNDNFDIDSALDMIDAETAPTVTDSPTAQRHPPRDMAQFLRKIPVTLTLEVGATDISLADLITITEGSVVELDKLAGELLDIKINGTVIGRAEVVVSGENYGLRVVELDNLDLTSFAS